MEEKTKVEIIWPLFKEAIKILADKAAGDDGKTQVVTITNHKHHKKGIIASHLLLLNNE